MITWQTGKQSVARPANTKRNVEARYQEVAESVKNSWA